MKTRPRRFDPIDIVALLYLIVWAAVALFGREAGDYGVETDFYGDFAVRAREWMSGHPSIMNGFRGPFYYIVLGLAGLLTRDLFLAAKLISVVSAAIGIRIAGRLLGRLWNANVGLLGAVFIAANPVYIEYSYRAASDLLFWSLFAGSLSLLFPPVTNQVKRPASVRTWGAAGLIAALAWLTRYNGAVLLPAAMGVAFITIPGWRQALARAGAFAVMFAIGALPWCLYLFSQTGDPFWNKTYENIAILVLVENPHIAQLGRFMSEVGIESLSEVYQVSPPLFWKAIAGNVAVHFASDVKLLAGIPWALAAAAGIALAARTWTTRPRLAFLWAGVATYVSLLPVFYSNRFMLPKLLWWAAAFGGLASLPALVPVALRRAVFVLAGVAAVFSTGRGVVESQDLLRHGGRAVEIKRLGEKALAGSGRFGPDTPIAARKPHIGYYLNAPVVTLRSPALSDLRASGAHYLLVSGAEVTAFPGLRRLVNPERREDVPPGLTPWVQSSYKTRRGWATASLYRVDNPLPKALVKAPAADASPAPSEWQGLKRIDALRLDVLQWYLDRNTIVRADPVVASMSPEALNHPEVLLARGDLALERNDLAGAARFYEKSLAASADSTRVKLRQASLAFLAGNPDGCWAILDELIRGRSGEELDAIFSNWMSFYRKQEFPAALALIVMNMSVDDSPAARLPLAYALHGLNRDPEAREVVKEVLRKEPEHPEAQQLLERLNNDLPADSSGVDLQ